MTWSLHTCAIADWRSLTRAAGDAGAVVAGGGTSELSCTIQFYCCSLLFFALGAARCVVDAKLLCWCVLQLGMLGVHCTRHECAVAVVLLQGRPVLLTKGAAPCMSFLTSWGVVVADLGLSRTCVLAVAAQDALTSVTCGGSAITWASDTLCTLVVLGASGILTAVVGLTVRQAN